MQRVRFGRFLNGGPLRLYPPGQAFFEAVPDWALKEDFPQTAQIFAETIVRGMLRNLQGTDSLNAVLAWKSRIFSYICPLCELSTR
jgi:hypothetical protein